MACPSIAHLANRGYPPCKACGLGSCAHHMVPSPYPLFTCSKGCGYSFTSVIGKGVIEAEGWRDGRRT
jgi:hypothetical protein